MAAAIPIYVGLMALQGYQQNRQAQAQASAMEANARSVRIGSAAEEESLRRQNALTMGEVRASAAQSGFDPSSGSLALLQTKTAGELELEALTSRYRGELQAIGMDYEAKTTRAAGKQARAMGAVNAFATLYGSQMKSNYLSASKIGGV